jgi:hypothetical protein
MPDDESRREGGMPAPPETRPLPVDAASPVPEALAPGDVAPRRLLARPPGDRYAAQSDPGARPGAGQRVRPNLRRGTAFGCGAALVVVAAWFVLGGIFDASWGLIVAGIAGGWLIGAWTACGAWSEGLHGAQPAPRMIATALALFAWLGGTGAVYLWTRAILPGSALPFGERLAAVPFPSYLAGFFGPVEILEIAALVAVAWYEAR